MKRPHMLGRPPVALLLTGLLLLGACDLGPTAATVTSMAPAPGTATTVPAAETPAPAVATNTPFALVVRPAGTLTGLLPPATLTPPPGAHVLRMAGAEPGTADPQKASTAADLAWAQLAFESLFAFDAHLAPVPAAAERLDRAPDGLTVTVTVRSGLRYADGAPLTARDFAYGIRRLFDPRLGARDYAYLGFAIRGAQELSDLQEITDTAKLQQLQSALGVAAPDDRHLVLSLTAPAAYLPAVLALPVFAPVRADLVAKGGDAWTEPGTYIGNGPFVLREWDHGIGAVWAANPYFRPGPPLIDRLEIRELSDASKVLAAYKQGQIDWTTLGPADRKAIQADAQLSREYLRVTGSCTGYLVLNPSRPPFDNVKVRQAVAAALDRQGWVDTILQGAGAPAPSLIPPGRPGYDATLQAPAYDPAGARALLAGVVGAAYPTGLPAIKLTYVSGAKAKANMLWLQAELKTNLGIDATLDPVNATTWETRMSAPSTAPQLWPDGWCEDYPDPQDWLSAVFRSDSDQNPNGWKNDQFDALTRQADGEADPARRLSLYRQAQAILLAEVPVVPFNWSTTDYLIKPYVKNMRESATPADLVMPGFGNIANIAVQR